MISTAKGIESDTFLLPTEVLREELPSNEVGLISGPNLAKEIANSQITATVVASDNDVYCAQVQRLLVSSYFRVYINHDRFGVELAGALKISMPLSQESPTQLVLGRIPRPWS